MSTALLLKLLGLAKQYWKHIILAVLALVLVIMMLPILLVAAIFPSADDELVNTQYKKIASEANLDWGELLIYDVVINDNDLSKANPNDSAYKFLTVDYKKYRLEEYCVRKDSNNNCLETDFEWVLDEQGIYEGKTQITNLARKLGFNFHDWAVGDVIKALQNKNDGEQFEISVYVKDLEDVIKELDEDRQEWAMALLAENGIYEMYGEYIELPDHIQVISSGFFAWPTPDLKVVTSNFGWRFHPIKQKNLFHNGIDIAGNNAHGKPIISVADGVVFQVNYSNGESGYNVRIKHYDNEGNEWQSKYSHMSVIKVSVGDTVKQGDVIGAVGNTGNSTGSHLHFELKFNNQLVNPLDYLR